MYSQSHLHAPVLARALRLCTARNCTKLRPGHYASCTCQSSALSCVLQTRNLLFLRDSLHLEVTDVQPTSRVQWILDDGHATFTYTFSLLPAVGACGKDATDVLCDVVCTACYGGQTAARLACFMQQKDCILLQRLKAMLENDEAAESCTRGACGPIAVC